MEGKREFFIRRMHIRFQVKVLMSILIPVAAFCTITNLTVGMLLGREIFVKRADIERGYLSVISSYLEDAKYNLDTLALYAETSADVQWAMKYSRLDSVQAKKYALDAQETLATALKGSPIEEYVEHMCVVNREDMSIVVTQKTGIVTAQQVWGSPLLTEQKKDRAPSATVAESVIDEGETRLAYAYPLDIERDSFIYIEVNEKMITDLLSPYADSAAISIRSGEDTAWYSQSGAEETDKTGNTGGGGEEKLRETEEFSPFGLEISVRTDEDIYSTENHYIAYVILATLALTGGMGLAVARLVSKRITQPLRRLSGHIKRLTEERMLETDPTIEEGNDEVAEIGREFNRLIQSIRRLIKRQKRLHEQKQRLEMNALQAQINPHFLYNTLDSIRWMAVIQKADNIANTVMSLEKLLRNMAKGVGDKITLREELALAQDYVNLQQVRYMEIFDYICDVPEEYLDCRIIKMTMQPIIENAIFHGIEPTGMFGRIRVYAHDTEKDLYISIEDNGTGMSREEIVAVTASEKGKNSISGIGVMNVDERLKMNYGKEYGLSFEGEKGRFTRVTIHIPKEKGTRGNTDV